MVSNTVMVAFALAVLPLASLTVNTTLLAPKLEQLNDVLDKLKLVIPTLSVEPLFTRAAVTVALPVPST